MSQETKQQQDIKFNQANKLGVGHRELALKSEKGIPPKMSVHSNYELGRQAG